MAADLASRPHSGLEVQLCGDAHVLNFGLWATPERNLNFDLRDFDETLPGPVRVGRGPSGGQPRRRGARERAQGGDGPRPRSGRQSTPTAAHAPLRRACTSSTSGTTAPRSRSFVDYFERADRGRVKVYIEKRKDRRTSRGAFPKLTTMAHGRPRITTDPPLRVCLSDDEQDEIVDVLLAGYRLTLQEDRRTLFDRFTEADTVRQVVGVGSVGMLVYLVLLEGRSGADPLFLQCKQAGPSVYEAHLRPAVHTNHGERVVAGKRMVQSATDLFVGWGALRGRDFYVRQYRDMKLIPTTEMIAPRLARFATACGATLARAHARSGDPLAIDAYMGKGEAFTKAMVAFARRYAAQNERDHGQLVSAIARGDVAATPE